jgi:methanogenic corrinoid protein MtbC1
MEALYLELLAPAARHLGELWTADLCGFAEVTVGLCRLHQVLRELSPAFQNEGGRRAHGRRALLVPVPGDQHTFGLVMVAEFFRRAGWDVWSGPPASRGELVGIVRREWFAVVGFSASCDTRLEALASGIHAVRRASRNPAVGVLVGGPVFVEHPELATLIGADATAVDGRQATLQAESLLALFATR